MKTNIGKIGMLLAAFLLVGSVFAGSVVAAPNDISHKPTRDLFKWVEKYYNQPGKHIYNIKNDSIEVNVLKQGKTANMTIAVKGQDNYLVESNIAIEKINSTAFKITSNGRNAIITPETSLIDPVVKFNYYVGSYPNTYSKSGSNSECDSTWIAGDASKLSTSTGNLNYDGPRFAFVSVFVTCVPAIHLNTLWKITDTKGFSLNSGEISPTWPEEDNIFYPYSNTYTWKTVEVNWIYGLL